MPRALSKWAHATPILTPEKRRRSRSEKSQFQNPSIVPIQLRRCRQRGEDDGLLLLPPRRRGVVVVVAVRNNDPPPSPLSVCPPRGRVVDAGASATRDSSSVVGQRRSFDRRARSPLPVGRRADALRFPRRRRSPHAGGGDALLSTGTSRRRRSANAEARTVPPPSRRRRDRGFPSLRSPITAGERTEGRFIIFLGSSAEFGGVCVTMREYGGVPWFCNDKTRHAYVVLIYLHR